MDMSKELYIAGTIRTNNFTDSEMMKKITELWNQVGTLELPEDATIYGIYHNYESDFHGDYDLTVAVNTPVSATKIILPEEKYQKFSVDTDEENGIIKSWERIWQADLKRKYTFDFEKYNPDGSVEIYIAVE